MTSTPWTLTDASRQDGRVAVITGANSGIGLEVAQGLATLGATVVLACRSRDAATTARAAITQRHPRAVTEFAPLDLADLSSVRRCADTLRQRHSRIDLLINNAGIRQRTRAETSDGFETHFGVNFLGHFALTGLLNDRTQRVVMVSSVTHRRGIIDFDDLNSDRKYRGARAYANSKLAQVLFMYELNRRHGACCLAAHPGSARTALLRDQGWQKLAYHPLLRFSTSWFVQDADAGALPILRAAADPAAVAGDFYGPGGRFQTIGPPVKVDSAASARDPLTAARLWEAAESLTGVTF
ncbi:oxidoreductase [Mycobacterium sp. ITM-2016-00317]|uniref:oxidoreductase n=1 Tax=Mycobacterium sp. ITM-2016-00317 TaxID=2099694 RepID=UPI00287F6744|nr:oxidoreductase [Mycobacterium sp. ITM-2016-00317]WNG87253.1 oxidoreductase [Mycobacterium sp. ITM-2016-00317]